MGSKEFTAPMLRKARRGRSGRKTSGTGRAAAGRARQNRAGGGPTSERGPPPAGRDAIPRPVPAVFPIVVIGASAGGLEAFKRFFAHVPSDSGMAFVLIPHLDPTHKSLIAELLNRQATIPAVEATHGMLVRPNHIYIIPPNRYLEIHHRRLVLSEPPEPAARYGAIDAALQSVARDQGPNAIGIVLSGTGGHGTAGLKDIKLAGGLVLVQDPDTALHEQMPRSALSAGMQVDYVLAPEKMPEALIAYRQQTARSPPFRDDPLDAGTLEEVRAILALLQGRTKQDFRHYRKSMILRRIQRRMALQRVEDLPHYLEHLRGHAEELEALRRDLLIGVTLFFREPEAFEALAAEVLPALVSQSSVDSPVRVWVPACSTGEEAYSIAILLAEQFRAARMPTRLQMFATDVDEEALKIARRGIYPDSIVKSVSSERLQRYFVRTEPHHFQVSKPLRDAIVFAPQNLLSDPPFSKLDLISCRNALIYLEPEVQTRLISLFHFALNEGGYLLLGPAETVGPGAGLFQPISRKWRLFRKAGAARGDVARAPIGPWTGRRAPVESFEPLRRPAQGPSEVMQRLLLDEYAPAATLVNRKYQILSVQGPVVRYLQIPSGELAHDLLSMARDSLRAAIRTACEKAVRRGAKVRERHARVRRNGGYVSCSITVRPLTQRGTKDTLLLVVFEDEQQARTGAGRPRGRAAPGRSGMRQLEEELRATRTDLQHTITELQNTNEDLRASNEEVMSMNEELQSTNEELESSKEELQSLNEELSTVNNQLEEKIGELDAANNDLSNLVAATDSAIVFLDPELRVRRFTAPAGTLLNLLPGDVGRPFLHFAPRFTGDGMAEEVRQVISTGTPLEKHVSDEKRWYLRRILPYQVAEEPQGVVVTFYDVTRRIKVEQRLQALNDELERRVTERTRDLQGREWQISAILDASADALVAIDGAGTIVSFNKSATRLFGYTPEEAIGQNVRMLMPPGERALHDGYLRRYHETHERRMIGKPREMNACRKDNAIFPIQLSVSEVEGADLFVGSIHDRTSARALQEEVLHIAMLEQGRIGQELHDGTQQELIGLGLLAQNLRETLAQQRAGAPEQVAARIAEGIGQANLHLRAISRGLVPVPIEADGLPPALRELASSTQQAFGLTCRLECRDSVSVANAGTATHLYRIAQEAVSNAVRHARADTIVIRLVRVDRELRLEIRDNGIGIGLQPRRGPGVGLRLMEHRCTMIGGRFSASPNEDGTGTVVVCAIPTPAAEPT